ncbi:MAG: hypothetical protein ACKOTF_06715 [Opitutaceae bacterium]
MPAHVPGAGGQATPSNKLNVGVIGVGRQIVAALAETKADANTIVVFLGDNGYSLGNPSRIRSP